MSPKTEPFDRYSDAYDTWFDEHAGIYASELETIRRLLPSRSFQGLEVGAGSGKFAAPLGIRTGVEPSQKMAAKARDLGIKIVNGVAEDLPFSDASFDLVLMITTVCFVDDPVLAFGEVWRVLRTGGCFIVGFVDKESVLGQRYMRRSGQSRFYAEARFFSTREILDLLAGSGFHIKEKYQTLIPGRSVKIIRRGSGKGAFVAVKAEKQESAGRSLRDF
ncbi:MAG: class I SAM-dependent methyltransferase [Fidelibacterota bacterium]